MATLTDNAFPIKDRAIVSRGLKLKASETFYDHVILEKSAATDTVAPFVKAASKVFAGVKLGYVKTGAGGGLGEVALSGESVFTASGLTADSFLKKAFADDDNTIYGVTAANRMVIGIIIEVISATQCVVRFNALDRID